MSRAATDSIRSPALPHWLRKRLLGPTWLRRIALPLLVKRQFRQRFGRPLPVKDPRTFSEKINWLKAYGRLGRLTSYADKYRVRDYVASTCPDVELPALLAIADHARDIEWDALPERFVAKASHGSGWTLLVPRKRDADLTRMATTLDHWMRRCYFNYSLEAQYARILPRIIVEEFLGAGDEPPPDRKVHCFGGEPRYVQSDFSRHGRHTQTLHDTDWNLLPVRLHYPRAEVAPAAPANLGRMLEIARRLSAPFPYVRVDLYEVGDAIYFGELTFCPNSGLTRFEPHEFDHVMGNGINMAEWRGFPDEFSLNSTSR